MSIFARIKGLVKRIVERIRPKPKDVIIFEEKPIEKPIEKKEIVKEEKIEKPIEKTKVEKPIEKKEIVKPKKPKKMQVIYIHTFQFYCQDLRYKNRKYIHTFKIASKTKSEIMNVRIRVLNEHHRHFPYHFVEKYQYIKTEVKVIMLGKKKKHVIS